MSNNSEGRPQKRNTIPKEKSSWSTGRDTVWAGRFRKKSTEAITEMKTKLERTQETLDIAENSTKNMGDGDNKTELNETKKS